MVVPVATELFASSGGIRGVTQPLAEALAATDFTGYRLVPATGEASEFAEDPKALAIPTLYALDIHGRPGIDDLAFTRRLIVSERAADFLCARDPALSKTRWEVGQDGRMTRRSVFD